MYFLKLVLLSFISIVCLTFHYTDALDRDIIATTANGKIRGKIKHTRNGQDYYSFRGIRYAQPPIERLRFEPPQEYNSWDGIYDATKNGHICPQLTMNPDWLHLFSEDCLILNVFTKNLNTEKPVMVFIHGGAFGFGTSHTQEFGPQYLLDKDIVLVTLNYRLNILGQIATDTKEAPGNLAFKDQVMALKWVKKHIHNFGGNSNLITLFGQSAGANSVGLHLVSPMSQGLFHRAILMSGQSMTRIPALNQRQTKIIGTEVSCSQEKHNSSEFIECLRQVPFTRLIEASKELGEFGQEPIRKWNWVVEKDFGQERFLNEDVNVLVKQGRFQKIPIMIGTVELEFLTHAAEIVNNSKLLEEFNQRFNELAPICFLYERNTSKSLEVSNALKESYFNNQPITKDSFRNLGQLFSDGILRSGLKRMINNLRKYQDVFVYTNVYHGRFSYQYDAQHKPYGILHSDDLLYLFTTPKTHFQRADPENYMVEKMINTWTHFAANGVPDDETWMPSNATLLNWHELSGQKTDQYFLNYLDVWEKLYPDI